ncbi:hypothetical protein DFH09DRAFT_197375 [Mycena vulgaris]|nr:hypothetical protein DFH09DRAFT_197375 [Mycena vulgaris]
MVAVVLILAAILLAALFNPHVQVFLGHRGPQGLEDFRKLQYALNPGAIIRGLLPAGQLKTFLFPDRAPSKYWEGLKYLQNVTSSLFDLAYTNVLREASSLCDFAYTNLLRHASSLLDLAYTNILRRASSVFDLAYTNVLRPAHSLFDLAYTNMIRHANDLAYINGLRDVWRSFREIAPMVYLVFTLVVTSLSRNWVDRSIGMAHLFHALAVCILYPTPKMSLRLSQVADRVRQLDVPWPNHLSTHSTVPTPSEVADVFMAAVVLGSCLLVARAVAQARIVGDVACVVVTLFFGLTLFPVTGIFGPYFLVALVLGEVAILAAVLFRAPWHAVTPAIYTTFHDLYLVCRESVYRLPSISSRLSLAGSRILLSMMGPAAHQSLGFLALIQRKLSQMGSRMLEAARMTTRRAVPEVRCQWRRLLGGISSCSIVALNVMSKASSAFFVGLRTLRRCIRGATFAAANAARRSLPRMGLALRALLDTVFATVNAARQSTPRIGLALRALRTFASTLCRSVSAILATQRGNVRGDEALLGVLTIVTTQGLIKSGVGRIAAISGVVASIVLGRALARASRGDVYRSVAVILLVGLLVLSGFDSELHGGRIQIQDVLWAPWLALPGGSAFYVGSTNLRQPGCRWVPIERGVFHATIVALRGVRDAGGQQVAVVSGLAPRGMVREVREQAFAPDDPTARAAQIPLPRSCAVTPAKSLVFGPEAGSSSTETAKGAVDGEQADDDQEIRLLGAPSSRAPVPTILREPPRIEAAPVLAQAVSPMMAKVEDTLQHSPRTSVPLRAPSAPDSSLAFVRRRSLGPSLRLAMSPNVFEGGAATASPSPAARAVPPEDIAGLDAEPETALQAPFADQPKNTGPALDKGKGRGVDDSDARPLLLDIQNTPPRTKIKAKAAPRIGLDTLLCPPIVFVAGSPPQESHSAYENIKAGRRASITKDAARRAQTQFQSFVAAGQFARVAGWAPAENGVDLPAPVPKVEGRLGGKKKEAKGGRSGLRAMLVRASSVVALPLEDDDSL